MQPIDQPTVLFLDDEERILRTLNILFRSACRVLTTTDPEQALAWLREHTVHVVVSDQRMPGMTGAEFLARAAQESPDSIRILLTGYAEVDAAISALNDGEIWRYLTKPWTAEGIQRTVREAIEVSRTLASAASKPAPSAAGRALEILVIDEDPATAEAVRGAARPSTTVLEARTLGEAVQLIGTRPVGIIVTEITAGGDDLTHLLRTLKQTQPDIVSLVVTSVRDTPRLVKLINQAQVFRFLPKPVRSGLLIKSLEAAQERFAIQSRLEHVPPALRVEDATTEVERTLSKRIGSYLARLRGRSIPTLA